VELYTLTWLERILKDYERDYEAEEVIIVGDKQINFKPLIFAIALLHIFQRPLLYKLEPIEELLDSLRERFDFMHLVDLLRKEFSLWFREMVLHRDFSNAKYDQLSHEFHLLEEIVQKQVQIPLLDELKKLCMTFEEAVEEKKEVSEADRKRFVRLVNFFVRTEAIKPSKSSELIERAEKAGTNLDPSFAPLFSQKPEDLREKMLESFSRFVNERVGKNLEEVE
jgi:hypothetical protein